MNPTQRIPTPAVVRRRLRRRRLALACNLLVATFVGAQSTTPPPASTSTGGASGHETVVLSPFEVNSGGDSGYQAANTVSGSRLNTSLRDTPASISVLTAEFLSDIAANNLEEALAYATNVESDFEDSGNGFNDPGGRGVDGVNYRFRVRGIVGSFANDVVETNARQDNYNGGRFEISSGPNSVLFGLGSGGGTVSLTTKRARPNRSFYHFKVQAGSWDALRFETDINQVIVPKKLAVRWNGLSDESDGWRHWDFNKQNRWQGGVTYKPFPNTTIFGYYETGNYARHATWRWNGGDGLSRWLAAGSPVQDAFNATTDTARGLQRISTTARWTSFDNEAGRLYNLQNELQSTMLGDIQALLPESMHPFDYSFAGPGGISTQDLKNYRFTIEQRLFKDLVLEYSHIRSDTFSTANSFNPSPTTVYLRGDPNPNITNTGLGSAVANPFAGRMYMEVIWRPQARDFTNEADRLTLGYELDFTRRTGWQRWLGRHRFAGLLEWSRLEQDTKNFVEIVTRNGAPASNPNPDAGVNQLTRRNYVTPGDFTTYYMGNPQLAIAPVAIGGDTFSTRRVIQNAGGVSIDGKTTDAMLFATQSTFFRDRLVATFGYRVDEIQFSESNSARATASDPRVLSGELLPNEWALVPGSFNTYDFKPITRTLGAVFHATSRLSFFYNESSNIGVPRLGATVIPSKEELAAGKLNTLAPPTDGEGQDGGIMLDPFGNGKIFARVTYYRTAQRADAQIAPPQPNYFVAGTRAILDGLLAAGRITEAEYRAREVDFARFTIDVETEGYEAEVIANLTKNWTTRLTYSYSDRLRSNYFQEGEWYTNEVLPFFLSRGADVPTTGGLTVRQQLEAMQIAREDAEELQEQSFGTRPHKFNLTTRYRFDEGRLKGVFVGGGYRYQSRNYMQVNAATGQKYYGESLEFFDFFCGYRGKLKGVRGAPTYSLQLNVRNVFDNDVVSLGRYTNDFAAIRRVYLNDPRNFRVSASLEF